MSELYSSKLACPECGINVPVLEPRSFSFNSMYGACPECNGLGSKYDFDPAKVVTRLVQAAAGGRAGPRLGVTEPDSLAAVGGGSLRIRPLQTVRATSPQDAEPDPVWTGSGREEEARRIPWGVRLSAADDGRQHLARAIATGCWTTCRQRGARRARVSGCDRKAWR